MLTQSVLSLESVKVPVAVRLSGALINPTSDVVAMAFPAESVDPVTGDWQAAEWETDSSTVPVTYLAKCLVGPGGTIALSVGLYDVWVRVTDNPEVPARRAGNLEIV